MGLSEIYSLQKQPAHSQRTATRNFGSSDQRRRRNCAAIVQNSQCRLQMVLDADGAHIENTFSLCDCKSPKTAELRDTKYSDVCVIKTRISIRIYTCDISCSFNLWYELIIISFT
jgi:hypothetical protein